METANGPDKAYYDVIIIGGSYAGLAAAMALGRSLRKVLVIDSGLPCNRFTPHSHNFITQDGEVPSVIAEKAWQQVAAYATVQLLRGEVTGAQRTGDYFSVHTAAGEAFTGLKLLFATGIKDIMPDDMPGFADCWGVSVVHCPYCHGYEVRHKKLGIFANGEMAFEFTRLLHQWSKHLVLFTNGPSTLTAVDDNKLQQHNISIVTTPVRQLLHTNGQVHGVALTDGSVVPVDAVFAKPAFRQHCDVPAALGCQFTEHGHIQADDFGKTNVPGVYVAGDNASFFRSVAGAVAAGNKTGAWINKELIEESF
jgi:thioredoxin reductase